MKGKLHKGRDFAYFEHLDRTRSAVRLSGSAGRQRRRTSSANGVGEWCGRRTHGVILVGEKPVDRSSVSCIS